jgi:hypothetical protein
MAEEFMTPDGLRAAVKQLMGEARGAGEFQVGLARQMEEKYLWRHGRAWMVWRVQYLDGEWSPWHVRATALPEVPFVEMKP